MTVWLPMLLFMVSTMITPGPNNLMLLNAGLNFGVKRSQPAFWGVCIGFPLMVLIVALGFGAVFNEFAWIKHVLKIVGSLYMLYLAYQILMAHSQIKKGKEPKPLKFIQAVLLQWVNPKAWLMAIGVISIFTLSQQVVVNALLLSLVFFVVAVPCLAVWLFGGHFLQRALKEEKHRRWFNAVLALALAASIILIWLD